MSDLSVIKNLERRYKIQMVQRPFKTVSNVLEDSDEYDDYQYSVNAGNEINALRLNNLRIRLIPTEIGKLSALTFLDLSYNNIQNIDFLVNFKNLKGLLLFSNKVSNIESLVELKKLKKLFLGANKITDITILQQLTSLRELYIFDNTINDIAPLSKLNQLEILIISGNNISDITPLRFLSKLSAIDLANNKIKKIEPWIIELNLEIDLRSEIGWKNKHLKLFENPIESPPLEIISQGIKSLRDWFNAKRKKLNEIKILLVGEAKAGKTSLIKRLKHNEYDPEQNQTDGIVIEKFIFNELQTFLDNQKLHETTAYFWDFGGQEIMSSTHQFFMTKRSVYLLVLEARKDAEADKQVRQWLERIQTFGASSSVIIVGNKIDLNPSFSIDTTSLQKDYPQIKQFINVSSKNGENIEKLKAILEEFIPKAELFDTEIDERWIDIKNELQKLTGDKSKLSHREFISICQDYSLPHSDNQNQAINFLNDLGIVLHFDELNLSEYYVLDPLWVTAGVYRILTSETAARKNGELDVADLPWIVNEEYKASETIKHRALQLSTYSPNECRFLADIMAQFKLSYYSDQSKKILIPDLLSKKTPKEESEKFNNAEEKLSLIYEYKYMPSSIIPRLIVELKDDVTISWRTGTILKCRANILAEAMITSLNNSLTIIVLGDHKQKRDYLSILRYFIDQINSTFKVEVTLKIPLPGYEKYSEKYDTLIKMEKAGVKLYKNWEIEKEFEISKLLDGIVSREELQKQVEKILIINNMGDQYNINQAGAVGPNSSATNNTFNQLNNSLPDSTNYEQLTQEITALKQKLIRQASTPEQYKAIGDVAEAEIASQQKDGNKVLKALAASGKWVLDIAKEVGTGILSEIIKKQMGM